MSNQKNLSYQSLDKTFLKDSIGFFNFINCKKEAEFVLQNRCRL